MELLKIKLVLILSLFFPLLANAKVQLTNQDFFSLTEMNQKQPQFSENKPKRLVYFWATWCPDCKEKLKKELVELSNRKDLEVITISTDREDDRVSHYMEKENTQLHVFRDPRKNLTGKLKVFSVPHWAVLKQVGENWEVVQTESGSDMEKILKTVDEKDGK